MFKRLKKKIAWNLRIIALKLYLQAFHLLASAQELSEEKQHRKIQNVADLLYRFLSSKSWK